MEGVESGIALGKVCAFWKANILIPDPALLSRHNLCLPREITFPINIDFTLVNVRIKVCIESPWELVKRSSPQNLREIAGDPDRVVNAKSFSTLEKELAKIREITRSKYFLCFLFFTFADKKLIYKLNNTATRVF